jgi:predicted lactoylglutathione lyase
MDFFSKLGFQFNPKFTDENTACMIEAFVMLLAKPFFKTFTKRSRVTPRHWILGDRV